MIHTDCTSIATYNMTQTSPRTPKCTISINHDLMTYINHHAELSIFPSKNVATTSLQHSSCRSLPSCGYIVTGGQPAWWWAHMTNDGEPTWRWIRMTVNPHDSKPTWWWTRMMENPQWAYYWRARRAGPSASAETCLPTIVAIWQQGNRRQQISPFQAVLTNSAKLNSLSFPGFPDHLISLFQTNIK